MTRKSQDASGSTIRDAQARAGVSASTVSRGARRRVPREHGDPHARVRAGPYGELDYVADARAKAVAGVGTPTLAFVLEGHHRTVVRPDGHTVWSARATRLRASVPGVQRRRATSSANWTSSRPCAPSAPPP
ncbi:hypothetical protein ACRAWF_47280 [Streptomyces sp. L7]